MYPLNAVTVTGRDYVGNNSTTTLSSALDGVSGTILSFQAEQREGSFGSFVACGSSPFMGLDEDKVNNDWIGVLACSSNVNWVQVCCTSSGLTWSMTYIPTSYASADWPSAGGGGGSSAPIGDYIFMGGFMVFLLSMIFFGLVFNSFIRKER